MVKENSYADSVAEMEKGKPKRAQREGISYAMVERNQNRYRRMENAIREITDWSLYYFTYTYANIKLQFLTVLFLDVFNHS